MKKPDIEFRNNLVFFLIGFFLLMFFLLRGCYEDYRLKNLSSDYNISDVLNQNKAKEIIHEDAMLVVKALKFRNFQLIENAIHPKLGVRFSPYPYILSSDIVLYGDEIESYYHSNEKYKWGYDVKLNLKDYYNSFVYNRDFANYDEITYNKLFSPEGVVDNTRKLYPDEIIVEYRIDEDRDNDKVWEVLRLVFKDYKDKWYLVGVVNLRGAMAGY